MSSSSAISGFKATIEYRELDMMYAVSLNFKRKDQMKIIIMAVRVDEGFFWVFHIDIVVSCMDHENEMEKTTNQREGGLGLTLKGSSSPYVWIVFTPRKHLIIRLRAR